jgi:hypothetical protein
LSGRKESVPLMLVMKEPEEVEDSVTTIVIVVAMLDVNGSMTI